MSWSSSEFVVFDGAHPPQPPSRVSLGILAALAGILLATVATVVARSTPADEQSLAGGGCEALAALSIPGVTVHAARMVAAGQFVSPAGRGGAAAGGAPFRDAPAFCRVELAIRPVAGSEIGAEVWLPAQGWNGRLQGVGNRGWGGAISHAALSDAVTAGFAAASTDTGHVGPGTSFAFDRPEAIVDSGYRAVHEMTTAAKRVIEAFYSRPADRAYWNGCSLGGRQGLSLAQRYPDDYDGIVVGDPAHNLVDLYAARLTLARMVHRSPAGYIPAAKYPAVLRAVLDQCDRIDGVADGAIEDPRLCAFDPGVLQCTDGDREECLTREQVTTARAIYADVTHPATGALLSSALTPGAELRWAAIAGPEADDNSLGLFRDVALRDRTWDWRGADFATAIDRVRHIASPVLDAVDADLSPFLDRGGRLLMYHGWADPQTPAGNTVRYYQSVVDRVGAERAAGTRLFMVPGMGHCSGGEGTDVFDKVSPLVAWVERGEVPARIEARRIQGGEVTRRRPLCPWGETAVWDGRGDTNETSSFSCVAVREGSER